MLSYKVAGGLGLEPRLAESESAFLPLEDPPIPLKNGVEIYKYFALHATNKCNILSEILLIQIDTCQIS
jgi:hypothetical protein